MYKDSTNQTDISAKINTAILIIASGLIPLIVRVYPYSNEALTGYAWFPDSAGLAIDSFLACKAVALQILMVIISALLICRMSKKKMLPWRKCFVLPVIYLLFVILSAIASSHTEQAFRGSYERFEPVGVIVSYILIFYFAYSYIQDEKDVKRFITAMLPFYLILLLIGVMQGTGHDPFSLSWVKALITPEGLRDKTDISLMRSAGNTAYLTLYNENYLCMYFGLLIPVCISMFFAVNKHILKAAVLLITFISIYVLYCSGSASGWIAMGAAAIIVLLISVSGSRKKLIVAAAVCLIIILLIPALSMVSAGIRSRITGFMHAGDDKREQMITDIDTLDDEVVFHISNGNELHCRFVLDTDGSIKKMQIRDQNGKEMWAYRENGVFSIFNREEYANPMAKGLPIGSEGLGVAVFIVDNCQWPVTNCTDGTYYYYTPAMKLDKFPDIKRAGFFSDGFMSGRGEIWDKALPLLPEYIFLGEGANMFITAYPQDDYLHNTYKWGWAIGSIDVKAHSLYIGNWIENGMAAFLCMMAFFAYYIYDGAVTVRTIDHKNEKNRYISCVSAGMYTGCISYMITGLVNDSNVCTAPVFWTLLGISMALNRRCRFTKTL